MNYPKKPGFNLYQLRHCACIKYSVKTWFLKNLSVCQSVYIFAKNSNGFTKKTGEENHKEGKRGIEINLKWTLTRLGPKLQIFISIHFLSFSVNQ